MSTYGQVAPSGRPARTVRGGRLGWGMLGREIAPLAPYLAAVLAAIGVLMAAWWIDRAEQVRFRLDRRTEVGHQLGEVRARLEKALNARLYLAQGIAAYVTTNAGISRAQFELFASGLLAGQPDLRELALAKGTVVTYVYPVRGNEAALGVDLLTVPAQRQAVERAIANHEFVIAGPLQLLQGGVGLVGRLPIYMPWAPDSSEPDGFWGMSFVVIDFAPLVTEAGLLDPSSDLRWALRGRDGLGESGEVFFGDSALFEVDSQVDVVSLPNGSWQIAAMPVGGWPTSWPGAWWLWGGSVSMAGLVALLVFILVRDPTRLRAAVERATVALREREEQYKSLFDHNPDAVFSLDLAGSFASANVACMVITGYQIEELVGHSPLRFVRPEDVLLTEQHLGLAAGGEAQNFETTIVDRSGQPIALNMSAMPILVNGEITGVYVIAKDVTERKQAYELLERRVRERTRELSTLLQVSHAVASTLEMDRLLALILDQLKTVVDYTGIRVWLVDGDDLVLRADRGPQVDGETAGLRLPLDTYQLYREVIRRREPMVITDLPNDETPLVRQYRAVEPCASATLAYLRSWLGVPLIAGDRAVGMLSLGHSAPRFYTPQHAGLALAFGNQAAVAIENARLYAQAQDQAALDERQRLARELHDSVSQALYGIALGARTARTLLDRDPGRVSEPLDYVLSLAEAGIAEMRALIFELRPESIEQEGLVAALEKQAAALRARHSIAVEATLGEEPDLPFEIKLTLHRIAQEALHNVVKHARASRVTLRLAAEENVFALDISDDGVGFEAGSSFPGHLGLRSMRERITRLGGNLTIESAPGSGARVRVTIPDQSG